MTLPQPPPEPSPHDTTASATSNPPASPTYRQLRTLVAAPRQGRAIAVGSRPSSLAAAALEQLGLDGAEPSAAVDRHLLEGRDRADERGVLLCLRCRVSHAAEAKTQALYRRFGRSHQLDPIDLAATVLDDTGTPLPWPDGGQGSGHRPFSLSVIESFRPELAGLGHWAQRRVQSHPPLVQLLREHGLLLQRDWSLLAHASPGRMERAWRLHGRAGLNGAAVDQLHRRFLAAYQQAEGERSGQRSRWEPDGPFLVGLDPAAPAERTLGHLQAMAAALRRERLGSLPLVEPEQLAAIPAPTGPPPQGDQLERLEAALHQALALQLPSLLAADGPEAALRACLWSHYVAGQTQRRIAEACGCCQAKVTRRLQPTAHAAAIATTALSLLAGQPGFEAVGQSLPLTETQVNALRDHLLTPPADGDRPRLALWLEPLLPPR
jgi:hypothetical protein